MFVNFFCLGKECHAKPKVRWKETAEANDEGGLTSNERAFSSRQAQKTHGNRTASRDLPVSYGAAKMYKSDSEVSMVNVGGMDYVLQNFFEVRTLQK